MQIYVFRTEGILGPYSRDGLYREVVNGLIHSDDYAWYEGLAEWAPVHTIIPPVLKGPAPSAPPAQQAARASSEATRRKYLSHEASIRSLGILYYVGGGVGLLVGSLALLSMLGRQLGVLSPQHPGSAAPNGIHFFIFGAVILAISLFQLWLAGLYRNLNPRVVLPGTILAAIGLLAFPLGTLISVYFLYLIHCKKSKVVFSERYQNVIEETPDIRYKTSIIVKIAVGLLVIFLGLLLLGFLLGVLVHSTGVSPQK